MIYKIKLIDGGGDDITYTGVFETTRKISLKNMCISNYNWFVTSFHFTSPYSLNQSQSPNSEI